MTSFDASLGAVAALDDEALARPWTYREHPMDVRFALYRTLEDAQEAHVRIAAQPHAESRRILSFAQRAVGDLRGLLAGLPADLTDRAPRDGEWSIRQTLRHMIIVERRYALQTAYAIERTDADPLRLSSERLAAADDVDMSGDVGDMLMRVGAARAETTRRLGDLSAAAMDRSTGWMHYQVDVRFRLHRFAAHILEHLFQCEKTLVALGRVPSEARGIARQIGAILGEIEGLGGLAEARAIEAQLADRLASAAA